MKQEVKINVYNQKVGLIGYFIISASIDDEEIKDNIVENEIHVLKNEFTDKSLNKCDIYLKNINIVKEIDGFTPIEYSTKNNNIRLFLLEEYDYEIHFKPQINQNITVFNELLLHNNDSFKKITHFDGFLRFKGYVGKTFLDILEFNFKFPIEIKSKKLNYSSDYRNMIGDLAEYAYGLLFNINAPLFQPFKEDNLNKETYYERFVLIEYLFKEENLPSIFEYISRNIHSLLKTKINTTDISYVKNAGYHELLDVIVNPQDLIQSDNHPIIVVNNKGYIPLEVNETIYEDIIDTPENRFYKYFLEIVATEIKNLLRLLKKDNLTDSYMAEELKLYKAKIDYFLSQNYFREISKMDYVPFNSQVLQKKEGYKEILYYYLLLDLGINLFWDDLIDDFKTYQKKLSKLYEYWLYFKLANSIKKLTGSNEDISNIIDKKDDKWTFKLKETNDFSIKFSEIEISQKIVNLELCFNKTFSKAKQLNPDSIITHGKKSYSVELKPDFTIVIRFDEKKFYLHFDAKYRINYIDVDLHSFQASDIEKMHAYKDGIINSYGSFVLYPGNSKPIIFSDYSEFDYFGVGAIPLNPSNLKQNEEEITVLIKNHIIDLINFESN